MDKLEVVWTVESDQLIVDQPVPRILFCQSGDIANVLLLELVVKIDLELLLLVFELWGHFASIEVLAAVVFIENSRREILSVQNFDVFTIDNCEDKRL